MKPLEPSEIEQDIYRILMISTYSYMNFSELNKILRKWSSGDLSAALGNMLEKGVIKKSHGVYFLNQ